MLDESLKDMDLMDRVSGIWSPGPNDSRLLALVIPQKSREQSTEFPDLTQLRRKIEPEIERIPMDTNRRAMRDFGNRINGCLQADGVLFEYYLDFSIGYLNFLHRNYNCFIFKMLKLMVIFVVCM